ncbi:MULTISPECIES: 30S ribosome-binding factor RbfA [Fusobacterium]|uniref:30S ribosome-binding factor RbfA n=1 Tax=Fusobacterium TaxID=848 RepID=UPI0014775457|nr:MULTISPECIES: 30S ribosome-binding factor RbfA [Fusobacterium]NME36230.1 30S ribosome-binding factor RbfA [Fusobacterium sp. FSA-380-WT-3A]
MRKQRLAAIEKEVLRVISKTLLEDVKNPKVKGLVSLVKVRVTEDLKFADLYFTIYSNENSEVNKAKVEEGLNEIKGFLRKKISEELALRYVPEVRVKIDDSIEYAVKISKLLDDLKIQQE